SVLAQMRGFSLAKERKWYSYLDQNPSGREKFAINYRNEKLILTRSTSDQQTMSNTSIQYFKMDSNHFESLVNDHSYQEDKRNLYADVQKFSELKVSSQIPRYHQGKADFIAPIDWRIDE
ncbi:MAG: hypothetical protein AAGA02_01335, partial [Bacteroidota bacterium]